ncbi:MAG: MDR family MFS transporter [Nocardioides sp.]|uniref:MDR family MFS transporter n=1 Tax=Nocardioides sp. TaxID=35761 RepID=UPI0039E3FC8A
MARRKALAVEPLPRSLIRVIVVVILGTFMIQMDGTMVGVALNTLRDEFAVDVPTVQWVTTGYLLSMTMVIPVTGWTVDRFGARRMWMFALAIFGLASLACALSWSAPVLIVARIIQGLGGGMLLPLGQALLAQAAGPDKLGRVMGAIGLPAMLGVVLGPVAGGAIVTGLGWRWMFIINLPICAAALIASARYMSRQQSAELRVGRAGLDVLGLCLLSPALAGIVYSLSRAGSLGRFDQAEVVIPLLAGGILLAGFVIHATTTRVEPLIDLRLLRARSFSSASGVMFLFGLAMFGIALIVPLYFQAARGWSALHAGLLALPQGIGMAIALMIGGRLTDRTGPRWIVLVGVALTLLGLGMLTQVGEQTSQPFLALAGFIAGIGLGATTVPAQTASYRDVDRAAIPRATSAVRIFQQLGGSLGAAILAVVLQTQIAAVASDGGAPAAIAAAFGQTFVWALALVAVAFIPALFLPATPATRPDNRDATTERSEADA